MVIKTLELNNFGVYAGKNVFSFSNDKPIVLIGGMNGRGKTTFLEAVLLALYGENSFAYRESKYTAYSKYLGSYINSLNANNVSSVKLEFRIDANDQDIYSIKRLWSNENKRIKPEILVEKNGVYSKFLTDNWALFIENIFPSGIAGFYFFDGEKISSLATESTNKQTKDSIKALLGLNIIDSLYRDINRIASKSRKNISTDEDNKIVEALKNKKSILLAKLSVANEKVANEQLYISELEREKECSMLEYKSKGGELIEKKKDLLDKKMELVSQLKYAETKLQELANSSMPLAMVRNLLMTINIEASQEKKAKSAEIALRVLETSLDKHKWKFEKDIRVLSEFISTIKADIGDNKAQLIYNISDYTLSQLESLLKTILVDNNELAKKLLKEKENLNSEINTVDSYLDIEIDEKETNRLYKKIKSIEYKLVESKTKLDFYNTEINSLEWEISSTNSEYSKVVEQLLINLELKDDDTRIVKYTHMVSDILKVYKNRLQQRKVSVLADVMTDCFHKLVSKKDLINKMTIDENTIDIIYLDKNNKEISKESLSAGEKQLAVISLLWALAICSKKKLPVIIDTPLSRLDSSHRKSLIKTYFPKASEQTIILSTDTEIGIREYELMRENVSNVYTLVFDEDTKSTSIKEGYFRGA